VVQVGEAGQRYGQFEQNGDLRPEGGRPAELPDEQADDHIHSGRSGLYWHVAHGQGAEDPDNTAQGGEHQLAKVRHKLARCQCC